ERPGADDSAVLLTSDLLDRPDHLGTVVGTEIRGDIPERDRRLPLESVGLDQPPVAGHGLLHADRTGPALGKGGADPLILAGHRLDASIGGLLVLLSASCRQCRRAHLSILPDADDHTSAVLNLHVRPLRIARVPQPARAHRERLPPRNRLTVGLSV